MTNKNFIHKISGIIFKVQQWIGVGWSKIRQMTVLMSKGLLRFPNYYDRPPFIPLHQHTCMIDALPTSSSTQKFPVNLLGSLHNIAYAASAIIAGVLEAFIMESPPIKSIAAVAIAVAGQIALTPEKYL